MPLYIQYMGAEAYGLVGFFTMLQACFGVLDMGLTPTIGRETARYHGGSVTAMAYRQLFRSLSLIFAGIAVIGGGGLWLLADEVAGQWLNIEELSTDEVVFAVQVMAVSVALRWMGGLYRGVIAGSERLVWLSGFNSMIATLRFIVVFASMWIYGFTPLVFFIHQLAVALLELIGLLLMGRRLLPSFGLLKGAIGWSFRPVSSVLKFALTIAFTSSIWVMVTQSDKLILSGILPLKEYGYFTLAVLIASGIMVISKPLSSAVQPRLTKLFAEGKMDNLVDLYCESARLTTVVSFSVAITISFFPYEVLYVWTGNEEIAVSTKEILRFYVLGSGFLALAAFPSYLQNATGNLRYHLIGNLLILLFLVPSSIFAAIYYGALGASYVWFFLNLIYLLAWVSYSHTKIIPGNALRWLVYGFVFPVTPFFLILSSVKLFYVSGATDSRFSLLFDLFAIYGFSLVFCFLFLGRGFIKGLKGHF